ncbi:hypothetical protein NDU88_000024 [Pleurodeles waltl]|uniref:Uncharacterized protein n=1 Tax=Pleurodeles waltl TaxID=8319 RepID=A0AAV7KP80_PLEWA|nr:hypothetical protein NDU88_000024 [Pleurodeles waltl]
MITAPTGEPRPFRLLKLKVSADRNTRAESRAENFRSAHRTCATIGLLPLHTGKRRGERRKLTEPKLRELHLNWHRKRKR